MFNKTIIKIYTALIIIILILTTCTITNTIIVHREVKPLHVESDSTENKYY